MSLTQLLFMPSGRIGRKPFWASIMLLLGVTYAVHQWAYLGHDYTSWWYPVAAWMFLCLFAKRVKDTGRIKGFKVTKLMFFSMWFKLIARAMFYQSQQGPNRYGLPSRVRFILFKRANWKTYDEDYTHLAKDFSSFGMANELCWLFAMLGAFAGKTNKSAKRALVARFADIFADSDFEENALTIYDTVNEVPCAFKHLACRFWLTTGADRSSLGSVLRLLADLAKVDGKNCETIQQRVYACSRLFGFDREYSLTVLKLATVGG